MEIPEYIQKFMKHAMRFIFDTHLQVNALFSHPIHFSTNLLKTPYISSLLRGKKNSSNFLSPCSLARLEKTFSVTLLPGRLLHQGHPESSPPWIHIGHLNRDLVGETGVQPMS